MAYSLEWIERGAIFRYHGAVNGTEIQASLDAFYSDARSEQARFQIADFSGTQTLDMTRRDMDHVAAMDNGASTYLPFQRVAIVPPPDNEEARETLAHYCATASLLGTDWEITMADSVDAALAWVKGE